MAQQVKLRVVDAEKHLTHNNERGIFSAFSTSNVLWGGCEEVRRDPVTRWLVTKRIRVLYENILWPRRTEFCYFCRNVVKWQFNKSQSCWLNVSGVWLRLMVWLRLNPRYQFGRAGFHFEMTTRLRKTIVMSLWAAKPPRIFIKGLPL